MNQSTANRCGDMDPTELKIAMMRADVSQKNIADELSVSRQAVHLLFNNRATSHKIITAISKAINVDLQRIWPSSYLYHTEPRKPGRSRSYLK